MKNLFQQTELIVFLIAILGAVSGVAFGLASSGTSLNNILSIF